MAGPTVIGSPGGSGMAALQQGAAQVKDLANFMEQRRQFEVEQTRLNRMQTATWGWQAVKELISSGEHHSIKDVALRTPGMLGLVFQAGLGVDSQAANELVQTIADSPLNDVELMNGANTVFMQFGDGSIGSGAEAAQTFVKQAKRAAGASMTGAAPVAAAATPAKATMGETPTAPRPTSETSPAAPAETGDPMTILKSRIFDHIQKNKTEGMTNDIRLIPGVRPIVDQFAKEFPDAAKDALAWTYSTDFSKFATDVLAGRWEPPAQFGMAPNATAPRPSGAVPPRATVTPPKSPTTAPDLEVQRQFADWMFDQGLIRNPASNLSSKTLSELPGNNQAKWAEFSKQIQSGETPLQMQPVAATARAPAETDPILDAVSQLMNATDEGSAPKAVVQGRKLSKILTARMEDQMKQNPAGIAELVENSKWIRSNPETARMLALQQNAPAVYAADQAGGGGTQMSRLQLAKEYLQLGKAMVDYQDAQAGLSSTAVSIAKSNLEVAKMQTVLEMMRAGSVIAPELAAQWESEQRIVVQQNEAAEAARKKGDKAAMDLAISESNAARERMRAMLKAQTNAMKSSTDPMVQKALAEAEKVLAYKPGIGIFGRKKRKIGAGSVGYETPQTAAPNPTLSTAGSAFLEQEGIR